MIFGKKVYVNQYDSVSDIQIPSRSWLFVFSSWIINEFQLINDNYSCSYSYIILVLHSCQEYSIKCMTKLTNLKGEFDLLLISQYVWGGLDKISRPNPSSAINSTRLKSITRLDVSGAIDSTRSDNEMTGPAIHSWLDM
jgi:hypothetical protein